MSGRKMLTLKETSEETVCVYDDVVNQLLEELKHCYERTGKVTDEVLSSLQCVFQTPLLPAFELVDNRSITVVTCPAGRKVYQVVGSSGTPYTCFASSDYCSCPAYRFSVLKKEESKMCKHMLAAKLSTAMGVCKQLDVSDQEMSNMIKNIE